LSILLIDFIFDKLDINIKAKILKYIEMEAKKSLSSIESKQRGFWKVIEMDKITFDWTEYILSKSKLLWTAFNYINSELKIIIEKKKALSEWDLLSNLLGRNSSENNSANNNSNNTCSWTKPTWEGVFLSIDEKKWNYNTWHYVEGTKSDWNCAWKCEV